MQEFIKVVENLQWSVQNRNRRPQPPQKQSFRKKPLENGDELWKEVKETCCSTSDRICQKLVERTRQCTVTIWNTALIILRSQFFFSYYIGSLFVTLAPALFPSLSFGSGTTPAVLGAKPTTAALLLALLSETAAVAAAGEKRGRLQIVVAVAVVLKAVQFLFVIEMADKLFAAVGDGLHFYKIIQIRALNNY
uniref:Uncharacterized protein n=1 Tax=Glossina pallidipes TaxID=7398 RepID=A0A1B0AEZ9_GLOPL